MSNQRYFDVPFAFSGDKTAIPDPLQAGGTVSFTEGWNYNYQRNLSTDPAAIPIDRSTMNWLLNQITTAIQSLQSETVPEFILASQNAGTAISYGLGAVVLWSASGNAPFQKFVSIVAANTATPNASDPLGTVSGWQVVCDPIATAAQAGAGVNNASIMTPLLVAQQTALRALLAGSATQVFNVGPATAATHAPEVGQVQQSAFNYAGLAGGSANALTATLAPAATAYTDDLVVIVRVATNNTGATTLAVNGLAAKTVVGQAHAALAGSELIAGGFACFAYSVSLGSFVLVWSTGGAEQVGAATAPGHAMQFGQATGRLLKTSIYRINGGVQQVQTIVNGVVTAFTSTGATVFNPLSTTNFVTVEANGGGGAGAGGGGAGSTTVSLGAAGSAGTYASGHYTVAAVGAGVTVTVGAAGVGASNAAGGNGGTSAFGALLQAPGGTGGGLFNNQTPPTANGNGVASGAATGSNLVSETFVASVPSIGFSTTQAFGAPGGSGQFGTGAPQVAINTNGGNAGNPGTGGSGVALNSSGGTGTGGNGAAGIIIVREYA